MYVTKGTGRGRGNVLQPTVDNELGSLTEALNTLVDVEDRQRMNGPS